MSDTGPPRKEPPPSELRIGTAARPVTRLSRRTLVVATALGTALVFAALWYALGIRPLRLTGGPELYNTNAKPTDALANMRDSYADLTRPKPGTLTTASRSRNSGHRCRAISGGPWCNSKSGLPRRPPIPRRSGAGASGNRRQHPSCSSRSPQGRLGSQG